MNRNRWLSLAMGLLTTGLVWTGARAGQNPSSANSAADHQADRVSFYRVPLVCGAAPQIGCGSRARPVLLKVDHLPGVREAMLNRSGTVLAVGWAGERGFGSDSQNIISLLEAKGLTSVELTGDAREHALEAFNIRSGWYRAEDVGRLSEEEAGVIAARLVRRVTAKGPLPDRNAESLRSAFETVFRSHMHGGSRSSGKNRDGQIEAALIKAGRQHLDKSGIAALREAIALGYRPIEGEL